MEAVHILQSETSQDRLKRLTILPDLVRMIVAGDYYPCRSGLSNRTLNLNFEWVVISPSFKVMSKHGVFLSEVIEQYGIFILIPVPPFIARLVEKGVTVGFPYVSRFTRARGTIHPFIIKTS